MGDAHSTHGGEERCIQDWWGNLRGMRPFERPRHQWEDNITMDLQDMGGRGMSWIDLAQNKDR
jgi:hypothetical protein